MMEVFQRRIKMVHLTEAQKDQVILKERPEAIKSFQRMPYYSMNLLSNTRPASQKG